MSKANWQKLINLRVLMTMSPKLVLLGTNGEPKRKAHRIRPKSTTKLLTTTPVIGHDEAEMNQNEENAAVDGTSRYRWWAVASTGQLLWGIYAYRRGFAGECRMMPLKAFAVASLFVGATASASMASLRACGIHSVEDMKVVGESIRTGLGLTRRARED
ncbi:uncharacterized protein [Solanum tuberosum]|uniref:uncharacterized protein n=1 Tax=Solanum tuberosum TaxID=4113 RepID=UPI0003D25BB8|nr:PREDICTED: uncharacterized protein LOC102590999 [Solanum tuberosum]